MTVNGNRVTAGAVMIYKDLWAFLSGTSVIIFGVNITIDACPSTKIPTFSHCYSESIQHRGRYQGFQWYEKKRIIKTRTTDPKELTARPVVGHSVYKLGNKVSTKVSGIGQ